MKILKKLICVLMIFSLLIGFQGYAMTDGEYSNAIVDAVIEFIQDNYRYDVSNEDLLRSAVKKLLDEHPELLDLIISGLLSDLDPYTTYITPDQYSDFMSNITGSSVGIGVTVQEQNGKIVITKPLAGSNAEAAGILPGDIIASVDGEDMTGKDISYVISKVKGDVDTTVKIGVLRGNSPDIIYFDIMRALIQVSSVSYHVINENIGYIQIDQFIESTPTEVKDALANFDEKGISKIIIDLRNNPGGILSSALQIAEIFVKSGPLVHEQYKDPKKDITIDSNGSASKPYKLTVLVNQYSASASELLSGTLKDTKAATLVGTRTYGKGCMQVIVPIVTGGAIKITTATYTTANNTVVDKVGVEPDYVVTNENVPFDENPNIAEMQFSYEINKDSDPGAILALEERLYYSSYYIGETYDETFDNTTVEAVKKFQKDHGLEVTGVVDIYTQMAVAKATYDINTIIDRQLEKALELMK